MADDIGSESSEYVLSLSTARKYSYATLTACLLAALFEDQREWNEKRIKTLVKHLELPEKVVPSVLAHMNYDQTSGDPSGKLQIIICEGGGTFIPLIKTLKGEPSGEETMIGIAKDLIENDLKNGVYDARSRVLVYSLGVYLGIKKEEIEELENLIAEDMQDSSEDCSEESEETEKNRKSQKRKRALLIGLGAVGGGTVIALTGGIVAPFVAAGMAGLIAGSTGAILGSSTGLAIITSLFGVAGAGLTAYRVKRRIGGVEEFEVNRLSDGKSLDITIAVTGWIPKDKQDSCSFKRPWGYLDKSKEQYFLKWESKYLEELDSAISAFLTETTISYVTQEALMYTVLHGLISAISWPLALLKMGYLIDNPWSVCTHRAVEVGRELANLLVTRKQGKRPVSLIGFSLGARVIFYCLKELANMKDCDGLIEDVIILGAPVSGSWMEWQMFRRVVAGRIVNGYCRKDWLLQFVYRTTSGRSSVAGLQPITWPNRRMVNVDLSDIVGGHLDYAAPDKIKSILEFIGVKTRQMNLCTELSEPEDGNKIDEGSKDLEQVEAKEIVRLILEERLDVALEVAAIKQKTNTEVVSDSIVKEFTDDESSELF